MGQQVNLPHPGEVLRDGVFAETGITITESRASATTYTNHRRNMRCVNVFNNPKNRSLALSKKWLKLSTGAGF